MQPKTRSRTRACSSSTIPEFQGIGTNVGQNIAAALAGSTTVADALEKSQASTTSIMTKAGYIK